MLEKENVYGGQKAINKYLSALEKRPKSFSKQTHKVIIDTIENQGYYIYKNAIDIDTINRLRNILDNTLKDSKKLKSRDKNFAVVNQPLHTIPLCAEIAFSDLLVEIAAAYLDCTPAIGTVNLRKSYVNDLPETDTLLFHCDRNSIKFLKFFFYLNDVDKDGGPFTYIEGSHKNKFKGWDKKYRWNHKEIADKYGKEKLKLLTANAGNMIIANTTGFHKGMKPVKTNRMMFTINYVVHPEDWKKPTFAIRKSDHAKLLDNKKHIADFLLVK